jgi:glyoxylase-like metal-dependent hydrolase (beta-lactamase superfamily II)
MKRFLALFLTIIMLLAMFASCKPNEVPEETTPESTTPEATTPDQGGTIMPPMENLAEHILPPLNPTQLFDASFGCKEAIFQDVESIDKILAAFTSQGYTQIAADMVEGAKFQTILLNKADELVTVYWIASEKEARVVAEKVTPEALSVLQKNSTTDTGLVTMVQIGVERGKSTDNPSIGMCYVLKLSNGNAMIIDGGYNYDECAANIYTALEKLNIDKNADGKYVIEAWIFTHRQRDHVGVLENFAKAYGNQTEVSYFLYQMPTNKEVSYVGTGMSSEETFHNLCKTSYPNAIYVNPHVGLNYYFGNVTVSMLYTPDVLWSTQRKLFHYYDNSLIFNVHGGDTGFLCMGDAGEIAAARFWSLFEEVAFESGILQVPHHGQNTGANGATQWDNLKKIFQATGAGTAVLPLGTRTGEDLKTGNNRWEIIFKSAYEDKLMSFFVNKSDSPTSTGYFGQELFNKFIADKETGSNLAGEMGYKGLKSLYGYNGLNVIDNNDGLVTYIACSDKTEMATVFLFAKGEITVKENEKLEDWLKLPEFYAKDVIAKIDAGAQAFESTFGVQEVIFKNVTDKASIVDQFTACGFVAVDANMIDGAKFETLLFTNGMELVTVYWKPAEKEVRVLYETLNEAVLQTLIPNEMTGTGELTFVQIGIERVTETDNPMIGLCYIVKLANGNAIVVDGGSNNARCAENIYKTLSKLDIARNAKGQYIIEAWIFTHGHSDHNGVMNSFGEEYGDKADVLNFLYQVPSNSAVSATGSGVAGEEAFFNLCKETYPNANYINPKTGLTYHFGNATVDMLYTPDVLWSFEQKITYYNDTSLIFALRGGNTGFLCFGDAGELAAKTSWNLFDEKVYKNGLLQITHHGLTTQDGATGNEWEYVGNIYEATGTNLVVLPMGATNEKDNRNGRYSVLFQYPHSGYHMSFVVNKENAPFSTKYFNADVFECFISDVETGSTLMQDKYGLGSFKTLYGYNGINMIDNGAGRITYISSRDKEPMVTVFTFANGEVVVERNDELYDWLAEPTFVDSFESTFDSDMELYTNTWDVNVFVDQFKADGFQLVEIDTIEGAKFQTIVLVKGTEQITIYWFPNSGDIRIARDTIKESALNPLAPNAETGKGEVIVAQVGVDVPDPGNIASTENNPNIGLCYIFKLSNGHAIIVDGGFYYDSNADNVFNTLKTLGIAQNENGEYIIEAWIFTHGHGDHNGVTKNFFDKYADQATVNYFLYQIPSNGEIAPTGAGYAGEAAFHELCKTACPESTYINPRAGVTYYFGNATVDVFHTPDIIWSHATPIPDYNDSGIIFRVAGGGVEGAIFMGDSGEHPATATVKNYDVSAFNANIVQISHHGLNTQINEGHEWKNMKKIYEGATVEYAFLPMGIARPNVRSGRWSVLCLWGYNGKQASFVVNPEDDAKGVNQDSFNAFIQSVKDGTNDGGTLLGYNGINMVDNGRGVITYIHCSETDPMVTIMSFKDGKVTVELNEMLYDWFEANK